MAVKVNNLIEKSKKTVLFIFNYFSTPLVTRNPFTAGVRYAA